MYEYYAELMRVVDGDTVDVTIGRLLGELVSSDGEKNANQMLLEEGHAVEYHGGKR